MATADHPHTDPGDGRTECETCGKWVHRVTHSCKGIPVTDAALARFRREQTPFSEPLVLREPQASEVLLAAVRYSLGRSLTNSEGCALIRDHWDRLSKYKDSIVADLRHVQHTTTWDDVRRECQQTLAWVRSHGTDTSDGGRQ